MNNEMQRLYSLTEFCKKLGISVATGKNWIKLNKIAPSETKANIAYFTEQYTNKLIADLKSGEKDNLKSRRNKKFKKGNSFYKDYISHSSKNIEIIKQFLFCLNDLNITLNADDIKELLAYYGEKLLKSSLIENSDKYKYLITDISASRNMIKKYPLLKNINFEYENNEDIVGLLYLSLKNINLRKSKGEYYTPTDIVKKVIHNTFKDYKCGKVTDPCCGSGNFILQLPDNIKPENIYAYDIDDVSVKIARFNFALKYKIYDKKFLYEHIKVQNFLNCNINQKFDYIIGNPPWAYDFTEEEKGILRNKYYTAQAKNIESYDVICEQALNKLNKNGILSFVLPEAVLNVKSHKKLREIIIKDCQIKYLEYLGESFDGVQCPSIIIQIINTKNKFSTKGMRVKTKNKEFVIRNDRKISADCFNFTCDDSEYKLIEKIENIPNKITLKQHAQFALGIVTGDNKKYLSKHKNTNNEPILKGNNIEKFTINNAENYVAFESDKFQQCAPAEMYRAKEKLLYKFISSKLVFAYDDKQRLTLNSCNILIPKIDGLDIKYILGILNSNVAQFYYEKKFNSVKVLRSHIEQIPIPYVDSSTQKPVIDIVNKILANNGNNPKLLQNLNEYCKSLYCI